MSNAVTLPKCLNHQKTVNNEPFSSVQIILGSEPQDAKSKHNHSMFATFRDDSYNYGKTDDVILEPHLQLCTVFLFLKPETIQWKAQS